MRPLYVTLLLLAACATRPPTWAARDLGTPPGMQLLRQEDDLLVWVAPDGPQLPSAPTVRIEPVRVVVPKSTNARTDTVDISWACDQLRAALAAELHRSGWRVARAPADEANWSVLLEVRGSDPKTPLQSDIRLVATLVHRKTVTRAAVVQAQPDQRILNDDGMISEWGEAQSALRGWARLVSDALSSLRGARVQAPSPPSE